MLAASYVISSPLSVPVTTKKRFYLNLNQYRNANHFTLAKAKVNFHEIMAPRVKSLPQFDTVHLIFTLFTGSEQLVDTPNVCSIVDKFFSDVLVKCNKIKDDNRKIVLSVTYRYGEIDRLNPRVEVTIVPGEFASAVATEQPKGEKPMQITINQVEIEKAIEARIRSQIMVREGFRIDIDLKATRGPEGYQAVIDIVEDDAAPAPNRSTGVSEVATEVKSSRTSAPAKAAPKSERPTAVTKPKAEKAEKAETPVEPQPEPEAETDQPDQAEASEDPAPELAGDGSNASGGGNVETTELAPVTPTAPFATPVVEPEAEAAPAARPSLFGNLGKPENN